MFVNNVPPKSVGLVQYPHSAGDSHTVVNSWHLLGGHTRTISVTIHCIPVKSLNTLNSKCSHRDMTFSESKIKGGNFVLLDYRRRYGLRS